MISTQMHVGLPSSQIEEISDTVKEEFIEQRIAERTVVHEKVNVYVNF